MAASVEFAGKQLHKTCLKIVLKFCVATLTFMTEQDVPGVRWMCSYAICKQMFEYVKRFCIFCQFLDHFFFAKRI